MTQLIRYEAMRHAIVAARGVDEVKDVRDKAEALRLYARQSHDVELERWVSEIKLRAIRRIGELSAALETAKPDRGHGAGLPSSGKAKSEVLRAAGISTSAAHRAEQIAAIPAPAFESYIEKKASSGKPVTVNEAITFVVKTAAERKRADVLHKPAAIAIDGLHHGDFRTLSSRIADESVELVFTDPPYDRDSLPLYEDAAKEAARILKPGGSMICYVGQVLLPDALQLMSRHLRYWWTAACVHHGGNQMMQKIGVRCGWKPMLWFVKGTRGDVTSVLVDTVSGAREKDAHEWQQAEAEALHFIRGLTGDSGMVVDFFAGGGTTCVAAERLGRKWAAFEVDARHYESAVQRITQRRKAA